MLWDGLETGVQWLLAEGLVMYWSITAASRAHERIVTSRAAASRSRNDANLVAAKHRDPQVSGMIDDVGRVYRWR